MLLAQLPATNKHSRKFCSIKNHFAVPSHEAMKQDIFSKKISHSYIFVLKMWYFNQGQVIMTTKTSYGNFHFLNYHITDLYATDF